VSGSSEFLITLHQIQIALTVAKITSSTTRIPRAALTHIVTVLIIPEKSGVPVSAKIVG